MSVKARARRPISSPRWEARDDDRAVAPQADADRSADERAQGLDDGAREKQRKLDREQEGDTDDDAQRLARVAD